MKFCEVSRNSILKVEKQTSFIPKKVTLAVLIFSKGFGNNIIGVQIVRSLRAFIQSIMLSGIEAETATVSLQGATLLKSGHKWPAGVVQ